MTRFIRHISKHWRTNIDGYNALHQFSIDQPEAFWDALWDFLEIIGEKGSDIILDRDALPGARWFPQARINFAENHLRRRDEAAALIGRTESGARRTVSWRELYEAVSRLQQALVAAGFQAGDRVAACLPNTPEAVIGVLGTTSLGGIWSACAPEYGEQALLDRVSTIEPTVLLIADGYTYAGKQFDLRGKA
ncbi:MAG: AMP-binding protein, partial [Acidobacteriota bacterium]